MTLAKERKAQLGPTVAALLIAAALALAPSRGEAQEASHGLLAVGEIYDHPGNYVTRATAASWTGPLALTSNIYTRLDVALMRPLLDWSDRLPKVGPNQRNADFRFDLATLPLAFGPIAVGAGVSVLDTATFDFARPIGDISKGNDFVTGFGAYAVGVLVLQSWAAVVGHWGTAWVSEGLVHDNRELVGHLALTPRFGLTASWSEGELWQGSSRLSAYETYTLGLEALSIY